MAFVFRNCQNGGPTASTATVTKPTGTIDGDLMVGACYFTTSGGAAPAGWTAGDTITPTGAGPVKTFWKIASGEGASFAFTGTGTGTAMVMTFSGTDQNVTLDQHSVAAGSASTSMIATGVTTAYANELQAYVFLAKLSAGSPTITPPASRIEPTNGELNNGGTATLEMCYFISTSAAGATGDQTATASATTQGHASFLMTFIPFQPVLPPVMAATGAALVPTVQMNARAPLSTATAAEPAPTVQVRPSPSVMAATATELAPTLGAFAFAPAAMTATATELAPTLGGFTFAPAAMTATAAELAPTLKGFTFPPGVMTATAASSLPSVQVRPAPSAMTATAAELAPSLGAFTYLATLMSATAAELTPSVQLRAAPSTMSATGQMLLPSLGGFVFAPSAMTATGQLLSPTVRIALTPAVMAALASSPTGAVALTLRLPAAMAALASAPTVSALITISPATAAALAAMISSPRVIVPILYELHGVLTLASALDGSVIMKAHDINGNDLLDAAFAGTIRLKGA